jgi:hypothetical protein
MGVGQADRRLGDVVGGCFKLGRPVLLDERLEIDSLDVLHDHVMGVSQVADVVHPHDVGVVERRRRFRLQIEAF